MEEICAQVSAEGEVCVAANYNCPGQIVISGSIEGINKACELMKAAGAKRALPLKVGGAFHSPLMNPAKVELEAAINATEFHTPKCPVYQNVDALPHTDPAEIKKNLVAQLTASVRWTQTVKNMVADGDCRLHGMRSGCSIARTYQENRQQCIGSRHCITDKRQLNAKGGYSKKTNSPFFIFSGYTYVEIGRIQKSFGRSYP